MFSCFCSFVKPTWRRAHSCFLSVLWPFLIWKQFLPAKWRSRAAEGGRRGVWSDRGCVVFIPQMQGMTQNANCPCWSESQKSDICLASSMWLHDTRIKKNAAFCMRKRPQRRRNAISLWGRTMSLVGMSCENFPWILILLWDFLLHFFL